MGYNPLSEYPRGHASGDLTTDPTTVLTDATSFDVSWLMLTNTGTATDDITITQVGGTDFSFIVAVPADGTVVVPGFHTDDGLRLAGGAAAVKYWCAYRVG